MTDKTTELVDAVALAINAAWNESGEVPLPLYQQEAEALARAAVAETVEACAKALSANIGTLGEQRRRCQRWGKSHSEIDTAIAETEAAIRALGGTGEGGGKL